MMAQKPIATLGQPLTRMFNAMGAWLLDNRLVHIGRIGIYTEWQVVPPSAPRYDREILDDKYQTSFYWIGPLHLIICRNS
jgi:hypothetical protein